MADNNLAKIQRVSLREGWEHEARDFTPWLADNIYELNEALDVDLEVQEQESSVGSRSLDILAIDLSDGRPVIIENQLERTDNDHLSRLLIGNYIVNYPAFTWATSYHKSGSSPVCQNEGYVAPDVE